MNNQNDRKQDFDKLLDRFIKGNNFVLTTHKGSDPDGIGSELALNFLLTKLQKNHIILNPDQIPDKYKFIDSQHKIRHIEDNVLQSIPDNPTVVIVDNSDIVRIGDVKGFINSDKSNLIVIDHHDNIEPFDGLFSFPEIGSTSEIIYELLELAGVEPDYKTALAIYLGIVMDTGQFKYSKTRPRTHEIAAKLVKHKFPTEELLRKIFEDYPINVLLLKRDILNTLEVNRDFGYASVEITRAALGRYDLKSNPLEGLTSELLGPADINASVSFTEADDGQIKLSFRSKGTYDVCSVAKEYNGGGHRNASGAIVKGEMKKVKDEVLNKLKKILK